MNHNTAIAHLTAKREILLDNASIAHAEMRFHDRDTDLDQANSIAITLWSLQDPLAVELPGFDSMSLYKDINVDKALEELKRDAWNSLGKPRVRLVPVLQSEVGPKAGNADPVVKEMLGVEEMHMPEESDYITPCWFNPKDHSFLDLANPDQCKDAETLGFVKAIAHVFLDDPISTPQPEQTPITLKGWFHKWDKEFTEDTGLTKSDSRFAGYQKATAHIFLDESLPVA
jgi:hypothetical protein